MYNFTIVDNKENEGTEISNPHKIKLNGNNFLTLQSEALNVAPAISEEVSVEAPVFEPEVSTFANIPEGKEIVPEKKEFEENKEIDLSEVYGSARGVESDIDDKNISDHLEGLEFNYGSFIKGDTKKIKDIPLTVKKEEKKISEKEFQALLDTDVEIMKQEMEMYRAVYYKNLRDTEEQKDRDAKLTEAYKKISAEEQVAKDDYEFKKNRTKEMRNLKNFKCLEIGPNEDSRIVGPVQACDEALKLLLSTNLTIANELQATIEQYKNDKELLNRESDKVRSTIASLHDERKKFIEKSAPIIEKIIKTNEQFKLTEEESKKAIRAEYEAISNETKIELNNLEDSEEEKPVEDYSYNQMQPSMDMNNAYGNLNYDQEVNMGRGMSA